MPRAIKMTSLAQYVHNCNRDMIVTDVNCKSPLPAKTLLIAAGCCSLAVLFVYLFVFLGIWSPVRWQCSGGWVYAHVCMGNNNGLLKKKKIS